MSRKFTRLTHMRLLKHLAYNKKTGVFKWISGWCRGKTAGTIGEKGYRRINVLGKLYYAQRLAWLYVHGVWPKGEIDHKNCNHDDNRIRNLRDSSRSQNAQNRKDAKGYYRSQYGWQAQIMLNYIQHYIGTFKTPLAARRAYLKAKKIYHPTSPIL